MTLLTRLNSSMIQTVLTNEDYSTVGYMDQTKKIGATLREEAVDSGTSVRSNVFDTNYRISTDGTSHSWESFDID